MVRNKFVAIALGALVSCASFSASAELSVEGSVGDVPFPERARSYLSTGDFVNVDNLRQVRRGMTKDQVRLLLGNPHFKEGIAGSKEWNYIFNFLTGDGDKYLSCQYQVRYVKGDGYAVESMHWDLPDCVQWLNRPAPVAQVPAPVPPQRRISLSADALFAFGKSGPSDILPPGRDQLVNLARQIGSDGDVAITVVGHTDRIGTDASNQLLSERRAESVRQLLLAHSGASPGSILAEGRGESEPVEACDERINGRAELIACLQPNRRVDINVVQN